MYKDKDKQREANRQAKQRQRAKGMTSQGMTEAIEPEQGDKLTFRKGSAVGCPMASMIPKRGKDIKCFDDLPPDVQASIKSDSRIIAGTRDLEYVKRTANAIRYQHLFPDGYHYATGRRTSYEDTPQSVKEPELIESTH